MCRMPGSQEHYMSTYYVITVKGHLDDHWSAWFEGLTIMNTPNGEALLAGPVVDQAALHGLLVKIRDLGLPLLAVVPRPPAGDDHSANGTTTGGLTEMRTSTLAPVTSPLWPSDRRTIS
jgi:hypothetical protein